MVDQIKSAFTSQIHKALKRSPKYKLSSNLGVSNQVVKAFAFFCAVQLGVQILASRKCLYNIQPVSLVFSGLEVLLNICHSNQTLYCYH